MHETEVVVLIRQHPDGFGGHPVQSGDVVQLPHIWDRVQELELDRREEGPALADETLGRITVPF